MKRLAILSTHPIQYNAPLFRLLAADSTMEVMVFFSKKTEEVRFDPDFGQEIEWDIPVSEGYPNISFSASTSDGKKALKQAILDFKPDALLVYGWNFPGHWSMMRYFKGRVPVWFRGDSTLIDPIPVWKKALRKALLTAVYRSVDHAFYVGQANKRYFLWSGLKESQLTLAPHAVDNEFFMRDDETRTKEAMQIRESLGISEEATVFLFVGKLEPKKQPLELADAFQGLPDSSDSHLVFIGAGELEEELSQVFGAKPNIHLVGFQNQSQMPIWYRVGDVLCLPSKGPGETWGLAVNEAMACGCTAIVSDRVGCAEDIVGPNSNCQIVSSNNRDGWSLALNDKIGSNRIKRNTLKDWVGNWNLLHFKNALQEGLDH